jgi:hypothetical protein
VCGANLAIVSGRSGDRYPRYGCPQNFYRGMCSNNLRERRDRLERLILDELQRELLRPEIIDYAVDEFRRQIEKADSHDATKAAEKSARKAELELELRRLTNAIAAQGHSESLLEALAEREMEIRELAESLAEYKAITVEDPSEIRRFVTGGLSNLGELLNTDVAIARAELGKDVSEIRMEPNSERRYYVATGNWSLLEGYPESGRARHLPGVRARLVAGAGFEPATFGL